VDKLCFGTYANIFKKVVKESYNQTDIVDLLLGLITYNVDIINQKGELFVVTESIASELLGLKKPVHKKIKEASGSQVIIDAARGYFEDAVIPEIIPDLISDLVHELGELISSDSTISQKKKNEFLALAQKTAPAEFLSNVLLYALKRPNNLNKDKQSAKVGDGIPSIAADVEELKALLKKFYRLRPPPLTPPEEIQPQELTYVAELLAAYADAEKITDLPKGSLDQYPKYKNDFARRRKDYYNAETIRRDSRDVFGKTDPFAKMIH
jgi:hypothetical protein